MSLSGGKTSEKSLKKQMQSFGPPPISKIDLRSPMALRREMGRLYRDARTGKINPAEATKLAYILELMRKAFETTEMEERLGLLESLPKM